jgi:hypothetical protein
MFEYNLDYRINTVYCKIGVFVYLVFLKLNTTCNVHSSLTLQLQSADSYTKPHTFNSGVIPGGQALSLVSTSVKC